MLLCSKNFSSDHCRYHLSQFLELQYLKKMYDEVMNVLQIACAFNINSWEDIQVRPLDQIIPKRFRLW
jgi:hypothetical protein